MFVEDHAPTSLRHPSDGDVVQRIEADTPPALDDARVARTPRAEALFRLAAARTPDATALIATDAVLTYAALDARVERRAAAFRDAGLRPGDRIGVRLPRIAEAVVVILAAHRAGLVYVPLDPAHPPARHEAIATDAGLRAVVDGPETPRGVGAATPDGGADAAEPEATESGEDLAYIIYTSGSTGRPKGVAIRHRSLDHLVASMALRPGLDSHDVVLATAAFSFDVSVPDLFLTLASGATIVLATEDQSVDGEALLRLCASHGVTWMQSTPSRFRLMLEAGWREDPSRAVRLLCGGEAITPDIAERLGARGELWNVYGPTETTVWSTARRLDPGSRDTAIGGPIGRTLLRVVDETGALTPVGGLGELLIGGEGVAAFYVGRPDLTAERFVPDADGTVFYRTGDLVRPRADGFFDFAGRNDHQIKLGGIRIEPGEIEAVVAAHPSVGSAVVIAQPDRRGRLGLVAYVVARRGVEPPEAEALEDHAQASLPQAMWPRVVMLDAFPLNTNGKLDRARLPLPRPRRGASREAPETDTERTLAAIWRDACGAEDVCRDDDFLALGGDSLAATVVDGLLADRFGIRLGVATLIRITTLKALAARIDQRLAEPGEAHDERAAADGAQIVSWNEHLGGTRVVGLHNLVPFRPLANALAGRHRFDAVALSRASGLALSGHGTVADVSAAYADILRAGAEGAPVALLGWCSAGVVALDVVRRLGGDAGGIRLLVLVDPEPVGAIARVWRRARGLRDALRRARPRAGTPSAGIPSAGLSSDEGGFRWLDDAIADYRAAPPGVPSLVLLPSDGHRLMTALRRRAWRRVLGPGTRFATVTGDHAGIFKPVGAAEIAALVTEALAAQG